MFSIDTTDNNDAIKQNGDKVEFSFNTMVYRRVYSSLKWRFHPIYQFQNSDGYSKCDDGAGSTYELFGQQQFWGWKQSRNKQQHISFIIECDFWVIRTGYQFGFI